VQPTRVLTAEHRRIEQALVVLSAIVAQLRRGPPPAAVDVETLLGFLRVYADVYHHQLEERMLTEALSQVGLPERSGPVAAMLAQHLEARCLIDLAGVALVRLAAEPGVAAELADVLQSYQRLLVHHIRYEEQVLYPFAERLLPSLAAGLLSEAFARRDEQHAVEVESQLAKLAALRRRYVE